MELSTSGAPFKIVRDLKQTADSIDTIIVDKNGARIALMVHFESMPRVMIRSLQLAPAYVLEGARSDLPSWTDLKSLARQIRAKSQIPWDRTGAGSERNSSGCGFEHSKPQNALPNSGRRRVEHRVDRQTNLFQHHRRPHRKRASFGGMKRLSQALPGVPMNAGYGNVTLEQVMRHRGGIHQDLGFRMADVGKILGSETKPTAMRDRYVRNILNRPPVGTPGSTFTYSNGGYALLSSIAEHAAGESYERLLHDLVYKPLGLIHSYTGSDTLPWVARSGTPQQRVFLILRKGRVLWSSCLPGPAAAASSCQWPILQSLAKLI